MNEMKLRGRIVEKFGSVKSFADDIGVTQQTVNNILSSRTDITVSKAEMWRQKLDIPVREIHAYFF